MNHYVYEITNLINGKKYIGKRSCNCHIEEDKYMGSGKLVKLAFKKYGKNNFSKIILKICDTEEDAFEWEKFFIGKVKAFKNPNYYNISAGGEGGFNNFAGKSEEELNLWKKRMSESRKGRVMDEEWKAKIVKTRKEKGIGIGKTNPMYGRTGSKSPVSKPIVMLNFEGEKLKRFECIREANDYFNKDRAFSFISRICIHKTGTAYGYLWLFEKDYLKMKNENKFDNWVEEMNDRYLERVIVNNLPDNRKSIFKLDKDTLEIIDSFKSIVEASKVTGISSSSISRTCRHGSNTAGGYSWVLVEEYNKLSEQELRQLYSHKVPESIHNPRPQTGRKVICITTNKVFNSMAEAIKYYNLCKGARIDAVCKGKRKTAGKGPNGEGLVWMYYDEYLNSMKDGNKIN